MGIPLEKSRMKLQLVGAFLLLTIACASADLYMHNPRGSNNRLDEDNRNRNDANRLFDSQNNNKGGYNMNQMEYYGGSELQVEWTNQHSCGDAAAECQIIMQYMCEDNNGGIGIRNGQQQTRIPENKDKDHKYGRHESASYWADCKARQRNLGLFLADQNIPEDATAMRTRQNNDENANNRRRGYECPEERDYYPYWHPSPWKDVAIFTSRSDELCPMYRAESQNVKGKHYCTGLREETPGNPITSGSAINNQAECEAIAEFEWVEAPAWGLPAPACFPDTMIKSRINHLGNGDDGWQNRYVWRLPAVSREQVCVFRMRYNITTMDYDGWNTYADMNDNEDNYAWQGDPTVNVGSDGTDILLKLRISTDQMGRTFQDRSSTFIVKPSPVEGRIINLNVMGQRGNIVQNYPSVEYDYVPTIVRATTSTFIHRQVTGSNTTPDGAGNGADETDRSNFVELAKPAEGAVKTSAGNYPAYAENITMFNQPINNNAAYDMVIHWSTYSLNNDQQNEANPYQDLGLMRYSSPATYEFMATRNNDFSNRSHKGRIEVSNDNSASPSLDAGKIALIAGASVGGVVVVGGGAAYVATHRSMFSGMGGGAKAPAGYA